MCLAAADNETRAASRCRKIGVAERVDMFTASLWFGDTASLGALVRLHNCVTENTFGDAGTLGDTPSGPGDGGTDA
jgi:hypothetical protein